MVGPVRGGVVALGVRCHALGDDAMGCPLPHPHISADMARQRFPLSGWVGPVGLEPTARGLKVVHRCAALTAFTLKCCRPR